MEIIWHGNFYFEIKGKNREEIIIVLDPFDEKTGLKPKKTKADILLISHNDSDVKAIENSPFLINEPGEYEVKGVRINGISSFSDKEKKKEINQNIIFTLQLENIKICHLSKFTEKELSPEKLENIFDIDVLLIPIGNKTTLSGKEAVKIINQIEPKIVIPMYYKIPGLKIELDDEKKFLKELDIKNKEKLKKLKIKEKELEKKEGFEVVLLEAI